MFFIVIMKKKKKKVKIELLNLNVLFIEGTLMIPTFSPSSKNSEII